MQAHPTKVVLKALNFLVILYLLISIAFALKLTYSHFPLLMDFGSFMASGLQAQSGKNPYAYDHPLVFQVPIAEYHLIIPSPNLNPPITIPVFEIISKTWPDLVAAGIAWKAFSLILYIAFLLWIKKVYPHNNKFTIILWFFSLAGFWQTIEVGQIYIPLVLLTFFAWRCLEKDRPILAGISIGILIAIKPQFSLWAILLLLINYTSVFISCTITVFLASTLPALIYGPNIYCKWFLAISKYDGLLLPGNMSILSLFNHFGLKTAGLVTTILLLLLIFLYTRLKRPSVLHVSYLSITCILLISPYSWSGYSLLLLPVFFSSKKWSLKKNISAYLLAFPFAFVLEYFTKSPLLFITIGWIYGWSIVLLLWDGIIETGDALTQRIPAWPPFKASS